MHFLQRQRQGIRALRRAGVWSAACALTVLMAGSGVARGADFFLTPAGGGSRDGSSWDDAFDAGSLTQVVNDRMQPGDRLQLGGGTYADARLAITRGGAERRPKTIVGVNRGKGLPVFEGRWSADAPTKGSIAIKLEGGVSHVVIEGLRIKGYVTAILASPDKPPDKSTAGRSHLTFKDVDIEQVRHGLYVSDCDDVQFVGCSLKRYTKHGFRLEGGCDRVTLRACVADCSEGDAEWEKKTELFPFGFVVNDGGAPNTALVFEDCVARNNLMPLQKNSYKNGDGFVIEANAADVTMRRCRAFRNQDGGFDLKVPKVRLVDCVAVGNSRNFRIWADGSLTNCFSGWAGNGLWSNGGPLEVNRCTFHAIRKQAVLTDDRATEPVTLTDCIISDTPTASARTARGEVKLVSTVIADTTKPENDPKYVRTDPSWDGTGDAMNSRAFPGKGYRAEE